MSRNYDDMTDEEFPWPRTHASGDTPFEVECDLCGMVYLLTGHQAVDGGDPHAPICKGEGKARPF